MVSSSFDANDWLDLCLHHRYLFQIFPEVYSLDCTDSPAFHWWKDADWRDSIKKDPEERNPHILKIKELVFQGVATAIDALSVGFTIANYNLLKAFIASVIIGVVTMVLCLIGVSIGRKVGTKIGDKATIIGGIILIAIGIEIFVTGVF